MAVEALTEPLLPRGRDDSSTPPAHSVVNIAAATTATAPAHRRAINVAAAVTAKSPAFAVDRDAALENASASASASTSTAAAFESATSPTTPREREDGPANLPPVAVHREDAALIGTLAVDHAAALKNASATTTAALKSAPPPTTSWQDPRANPAPDAVHIHTATPLAVHREDAALKDTFAVDPDAALKNASATTTTALTSASPPTTSLQDAVHRDAALKGPFASPPATRSPGRRANVLEFLGPARGSSGNGLPPAPPTDLSGSASGADASLPPVSTDSPADHMGSFTESEAAQISSVEHASLSPLRGRNSPRTPRSTEVNRLSTSKRDRRTLRGRRLYRRVGFRRTLMPVPQKDIWDKESFMYTCVLVLLVGLVAYLSTVLDGWPHYLRGIFIGIFGAATGLACIGAMALVSQTPDPFPRHFAHIVSRLTFIVGSLAFEAVVFYLLGEVGFIVWLLVAAGTILGMTYIWSVGSPESFATLVSCPGLVYSRVMGLFRRA